MWKEYINASSIDQVLSILAEKGNQARIIAGGTDLVLEMRQGLHSQVSTLVDISRVDGLADIYLDDKDNIHLGAGVTHNQCLDSDLIRESALPLALAAWEVGAPQIRNNGTIVGNLVTASPANDTIVPLYALGAELVLLSREGERMVRLEEFYTGVRKHILKPGEMVREVVFPKLTSSQSGVYLKLGLRKVQAISLVNSAIVLTLAGKQVVAAKITMGAVAPTIIHASTAEEFLAGKQLSDQNIARTAELAQDAASPIDDIRGSAAYRREAARVLVQRGLQQIREGKNAARLPVDPVLLAVREDRQAPAGFDQPIICGQTPIITTINGKEYTFDAGHDHTLLHLLRDHAGLTGTKVGCEEGECGACTVFLDGRAVMACLVPAPRAQGAEITTIEGLAGDDQLHPVQEAFIEDGAVQCGYCTPGFIMSAAKLLEENPHPTRDQIKTAISGNLCRCTGYYKIISAIEDASQKEGA
jgi:xanthine dehydrogenase iron-sulfur cluster and FAD-binding subunit A